MRHVTKVAESASVDGHRGRVFCGCLPRDSRSGVDRSRCVSRVPPYRRRARSEARDSVCRPPDGMPGIIGRPAPLYNTCLSCLCACLPRTVNGTTRVTEQAGVTRASFIAVFGGQKGSVSLLCAGEIEGVGGGGGFSRVARSGGNRPVLSVSSAAHGDHVHTVPARDLQNRMYYGIITSMNVASRGSDRLRSVEEAVVTREAFVEENIA